MKFLALVTLAVACWGILIALAPATAQVCPEEGLPSGFLSFNRPLVPCGMTNSCFPEANRPCTLCHLLVLINNIYRLLLALLIIVALLFITVGGTVYILSSGNAGLKSMAKNIIVKTLTGFGIFLLSWLIVYTTLVFISANTNFLGRGTGDGWFEFECETDSYFLEGVPEGGFSGGGGGGGTGGGGTGGGGGGSGGGGGEGEYTYQPGIESQVGDMSNQLQELLDCMQSRLPDAAREISSISDSAGIETCVDSWSRPPCAHSEWSCHYGGRYCRSEYESYAVDFGNETYYTEIRAAALECESGAYVLNEGTHIHVSIGSVNGCGCD